jgi:hypothetical protein
VKNNDEWTENLRQPSGELPAHKNLNSEVENKRLNQSKTSRFKSPLLRSFLIAFLVLAVAAAIHLLTATPNEKRKPGVYNAKDGSVYQVQEYLKKELAKPESFQTIHWSTVEKSGELIGEVMYKVSVVYKALDKEGKPFMASKMFELDKEGNVWMVMEVDPFRSAPAQNSK